MIGLLRELLGHVLPDADDAHHIASRVVSRRGVQENLKRVEECRREETNPYEYSLYDTPGGSSLSHAHAHAFDLHFSLYLISPAAAPCPWS
jgi:hypothetical protein